MPVLTFFSRLRGDSLWYLVIRGYLLGGFAGWSRDLVSSQRNGETNDAARRIIY